MLDITKWRCGVFETTVALMPLRPAVQHASVTMFCARLFQGGGPVSELAGSAVAIGGDGVARAARCEMNASSRVCFGRSSR